MVAGATKTQQCGFLLMEIITAVMVFTVLSFTITFWLCGIHDQITGAQNQSKALHKGRAALHALLYKKTMPAEDGSYRVSLLQGPAYMPTVTSSIPLEIKPVNSVTVAVQEPGGKQNVILKTLVAYRE